MGLWSGFRFKEGVDGLTGVMRTLQVSGFVLGAFTRIFGSFCEFYTFRGLR